MTKNFQKKKEEGVRALRLLASVGLSHLHLFKMHYFTKTGSGQTYRENSKKGRFLQEVQLIPGYTIDSNLGNRMMFIGPTVRRFAKTSSR
jgi:hypothetical protein